jgi:threonine/homoserine/homoserine lactone efflux protein
VVDPATLAGFALTSLLVELTPGPNMTYLALIAATEGRQRGFAAVAGVALGLAVMGLAAALGLAAVIAESPVVYQVLRWCGVGYLLWLAWEAWHGGEAADGMAAPGASLGRYFRRGLVTNLLNPKAAVFFVAVLPGFLAASPGLGDTLVLSAVYVAVATLVHGGIVGVAGAAADWLADTRRAERVRRFMALALVGVAVWMAAKT